MALSAPRRSSLQARLLATYLALIGLSIAGLILFVGFRLQRAALDQAQRELAVQSDIIANALREPLEHRDAAGRSLDNLLRSYAESAGVRVTLADANRRPIISSGDPPGRGDGHKGKDDDDDNGDDDDHKGDLSGASNESLVSPSERDGRLFVGSPISDDKGQPIGYVRVSVPTEPIYAEMRQTWLSLLALGSGVLLLTAFASLTLARQIARPIESLTSVSGAMAAGDLSQRVQPGGTDEIARLGRAFNQMADQVTDMLTRQQAFSANAAHELRSPLTALRLRIEMLQTYAPTGDDDLTRRYLAQMDGEVQRLQHLVDNLLALAAVDEAAAPPRAPLDLAPLLYDTADSLEPLAQTAGVRLIVNAPPHLPPVTANAEQLRMVFWNLLENGVKYTPPGGTVTLSAMTEGATVDISVTDTGIGIPADALPHIFERFYRVDKARSRRAGGAGLGLALAHDIVAAHGGHLDVSSAPGRGSCFTVRLPAG